LISSPFSPITEINVHEEKQKPPLSESACCAISLDITNVNDITTTAITVSDSIQLTGIQTITGETQGLVVDTNGLVSKQTLPTPVPGIAPITSVLYTDTVANFPSSGGTYLGTGDFIPTTSGLYLVSYKFSALPTPPGSTGVPVLLDNTTGGTIQCSIDTADDNNLYAPYQINSLAYQADQTLNPALSYGLAVALLKSGTTYNLRVNVDNPTGTTATFSWDFASCVVEIYQLC